MTIDIFNDLEKVRVDQAFDDISVEEVYTHIQCRKPGKTEFFRANPSEELRERILLLEHQSSQGFSKDNYLVVPGLVNEIRDVPGVKPYMIVLCVTRPRNTPFLWPVRLPNTGLNRADTWALSSQAVLEKSEEEWVRIEPKLEMQGYTCCISKAGWPEPQFPDKSLLDLLKLAFPEDRIIASTTHPVIRSLRGEI